MGLGLIELKSCIQCKNPKPLDEFYNCTSRKDGKNPYCIECTKIRQKAWYQKNPDKARALNRNNYARNKHNWARTDPGQNRRNRLKHFYKLTVEDFEAMLDIQDGLCAASCGTLLNAENWAVDHDHACCPSKRSCGLCVRGILCHGCNKGIGLFNDDPDRMMGAIIYLTRAGGAT